MLKQTSVIMLFVLLFSTSGFSATDQIYGTLTVIADNESEAIYIDGAFAGYSMVTIEEILPGTHQVKIKSKEKTVWERIVLIQAGQQTTIAAKTNKPYKNWFNQEEQDRKPALPINGSAYLGNYTVTVSALGDSVSSTYSEGTFGMGLNIKKYFDKNTATYFLGGFNYNTKTQQTQLSYFTLDVGLINDYAFTEVGLNYPIWTNDSIKINSNIGYQIKIGFEINEHVALCFNYTLLNGSYDYWDSYYYEYIPVSITLAHPTIMIRIQ